MRRVAVVVGSADCVFRDLARLTNLNLSEPPAIIACNDAGWQYLDPIDYWVTLHCDKLADWESRRRLHGGNSEYLLFTAKGFEGRCQRRDIYTVGEEMDFRVHGGSSGLTAVHVGLQVRDIVIGCGIPMDRRRHRRGVTAEGPFRTEDTVADETKLRGFWMAWAHAAPLLKHRFRSFSGWTRDIFGEPTRDWIEE